MRRLLALAAVLLAGCVSIDIGGEPAAHVYLSLHDAASAAPTRRAEPLVAALLIQALPADAFADMLAIAYSRRDGEFGWYQFASWTERPRRQVARLLQQRLQARGVAGAVGLLGDPLRADWLLAIGIDTLHHDLRSPPGTARLAVTADLVDRGTRVRVAQRHFEASVPTAQADSAAAAQALSLALGQVFDELVPWLEAELQRAPSAAR
jgi:ABC-type uncharacterized transport system auxiliary subunit